MFVYIRNYRILTVKNIFSLLYLEINDMIMHFQNHISYHLIEREKVIDIKLSEKCSGNTIENNFLYINMLSSTWILFCKKREYPWQQSYPRWRHEHLSHWPCTLNHQLHQGPCVPPDSAKWLHIFHSDGCVFTGWSTWKHWLQLKTTVFKQTSDYTTWTLHFLYSIMPVINTFV